MWVVILVCAVHTKVTQALMSLHMCWFGRTKLFQPASTRSWTLLAVLQFSRLDQPAMTMWGGAWLPWSWHLTLFLLSLWTAFSQMEHCGKKPIHRSVLDQYNFSNKMRALLKRELKDHVKKVVTLSWWCVGLTLSFQMTIDLLLGWSGCYNGLMATWLMWSMNQSPIQVVVLTRSPCSSATPYTSGAFCSV